MVSISVTALSGDGEGRAQAATTPTIQPLAQRWIDGDAARARAGLLKPRTHNNNRVNCLRFAAFVGEDQVATAISETTMERKE